ncbi:Uncharacterised protein [Comamonas terrigena]|nr:Uncharacterised protein [Comamonas terrigena]
MLLNDVFDFCLNNVFNFGMHQDAGLISHMGGATKLAARLGYDLKNGGIQRIQNWKRRGILRVLSVTTHGSRASGATY